MHRTGAYSFIRHNEDIKAPVDYEMPPNNAIASLVSGLRSAHAAYEPSRRGNSSIPGILFVVQPRNMNICDERPLEYGLWDSIPSIPAYRVIFGAEVIANTHLSPGGELLFESPSLPAPVEIAVVYMRAGYDAEEYTSAGCRARVLLESSRAIKCPSILGHLATFKKVQQALAVPGVLAKFLSPEDAATIAKTFVPTYPMEVDSEAGRQGRALALNLKTARNHVLKPSLEGGGHNIYGTDIPGFLRTLPRSKWHTYILMKLINPVVQKGILLTLSGVYHGAVAEGMHGFHEELQSDPSIPSGNLVTRLGGPTVTELGIFGVCMWRRRKRRLWPRSGPPDLMINSEAGWSLKTKPANVNDMSVVKGYGCFDSPCLVGSEQEESSIAPPQDIT